MTVPAPKPGFHTRYTGNATPEEYVAGAEHAGYTRGKGGGHPPP